MRIVLNANSSWYLYKFRRSSIIALINQSHEVFCLAPRDKYSEKLEELGAKFYDLALSRSSKNFIKDIMTIFQLRNILSKISVDIVINFTVKNNIYGSLASMLSSKSYVINNVTGVGSAFIKNNLTTIIIKLLYRIIKKIPSHTYFQNEDDQELFIKNGLVNNDKCSILPGSGIDIESYQSVILAPDKNKFIFIFVGRLIADKGIEELLKAIKLLHQESSKVELVILGLVDEDNPSSIPKYKLENMTSDKFITLHYDIEDVRHFLAKSHCFVLPSYREGTPRSALEAMAIGLPVILSDVPGCRKLIADSKNGFSCEPNSVKSLYSALKKIVNLSSEELNLMGLRSRDIIEQSFSDKIIITDLLNRISLFEQNVK